MQLFFCEYADINASGILELFSYGISREFTIFTHHFPIIPLTVDRRSQTHLSDRHKEQLDSSLPRTGFHCSRVQWCCGLHYSSQRLVLNLVMWGMHAVALPWKPIAWSSCCTGIVLILISLEVWNSSAMESERWLFLRTMHLGDPVLWLYAVFCFKLLLFLNTSTFQ